MRVKAAHKTLVKSTLACCHLSEKGRYIHQRKLVRFFVKYLSQKRSSFLKGLQWRNWVRLVRLFPKELLLLDVKTFECKLNNILSPPRVNCINALRAAFTLKTPKSSKKTDNLTVFFCTKGICERKSCL